MLSGKTDSGFEYQVDRNTLNDYELLEDLSYFDSNPLLLVKILKKLLGKDQLEKLKEHVREESGVIPMDKMGIELQDIFKNGTQLKKS